MADKRKIIELLPSYLRSDALQKVFSATVDNLFQPESVEFLSGYIGSKPSWYDASKDFYISESDAFRQNYQLSPTPVSKDPQTGQISNALFYQDLLRQLAFQGALTNNHDRLFRQEYYSWSPPIDLDKFVNYANYFWLPNGPDAITLLDSTDLMRHAAGKSSYGYIGNAILANGTLVTYTTASPLSFTSGLVLIPTMDVTVSINNRQFVVEDVGGYIRLLPFNQNSLPGWDISGWDTYGWGGNSDLLSPLYCTINRASQDGNQWSQTNRWFHKSVLDLTQTAVSDLYVVQALRPIIEFDANLQLWQYGSTDRGVVDIVTANISDMRLSLVGQPHATIEGVPLQDGMRILSTNDQTPGGQGVIWKVGGVGSRSIELINDIGQPSVGDRFVVRYGYYENANFIFANDTWQLSMQQFAGSTPPLFQAYDAQGIALDDPGVYPGSNFQGTAVFGYGVDSNQPVDPYIGLALEIDQFGDYVFKNNLSDDVVTYVFNGKPVPYYGNLWCLQTVSDGSYELINSWYKSPTESRQYIVNEFDINADTTEFILDQTPFYFTPNNLPTITVDIVFQKVVNRLNTNDYTISNKMLSLATSPPVGSVLRVRTWNPQGTGPVTGYYELPANLVANPNNEEITSVSRSQFLAHFTDIIQNQTGITGNAAGTNNYRDTAKNKGLGTQILQHRAPLLKLSALNSIGINDLTTNVPITDPILAIQYAQRSYTRFYNKFLNALFDIATKQGFTADSNPVVCDQYQTESWITAALKVVNMGKTPSSPWANSGIDGGQGAYGRIASSNPTYVPVNSTRLGITPSFKPEVYFDQTYSTPQLTIQTHDGSRIVMVDNIGQPLGTIQHGLQKTSNPENLTNPVAAAWLQFELDVFSNLPLQYSDSEQVLAFDLRTLCPGKWRTSNYTRQEFLCLQRAPFERWAVSNQVDWTSNVTYDANNPFSYNYSTVVDRDGLPIPGHWQEIYRYFYDTDRPHTHPWEMLGFTQKPAWWDAQYGSAPYTNGNQLLWTDLAHGIIRQGPRAGTYESWARSSLLDYIPVDAQGQLLPPDLIGCAAYVPSVHDASANWKFGDGGPVETVWRHGLDYNFVQAQLGYLMAPAKFVEYTWDSLRTELVSPNTQYSQWVYLDTNSRRASSQFLLHRETPVSISYLKYIPDESTLSYFGSAGFQHWISEYLISQGYNVTNYGGNIIRGLDVQLAHRMSGYINADSLRAVVDSYGQLGYNSQIVPGENIKTQLYRSASIGFSSYSGVMVEQVADGWRISGFDVTYPLFTTIPPNVAGARTNVVIGNQKVTEYQDGLKTTTTVPYGTVFDDRQSVYSFLIAYGRWLLSQGWTFENQNQDSNTIQNWSQSAKEFLFWSQGNWSDGTFIALSPGASGATFTSGFGNIQYLNGIVSGTYPVIDKSGQPIQPQNINVLRNDGSITVVPNNTQGVFGLKLFRNTVENAVFFDNVTSFGDLIYSPILNIQQQRIKIYTYRVNDWNGRIDAPGFIITQNSSDNTWTITSNFEKSANDFRKYFNIEQPKNYSKLFNGQVSNIPSEMGAVDNENIARLAKHLFAFQNRPYLQNLLYEDTTEFEFYQGFIRQKGTRKTLENLLRNNEIIPTDSSFSLYEEWLVRIADYGGTKINKHIEFVLTSDKVTSNPQWIRFFSNNSDNSFDDVYDIVPGDPVLLQRPDSWSTDLFALRSNYAPVFGEDLPTAGYVQLGEANWTVANTDALLDLYSVQSTTSNPVQERDLVWQFFTDSGSWAVWRLVRSLGQPINTIPSNVSGDPTTIITDVPHGLLNGDICVINGMSGEPDINGTYTIFAVTPTSFQISLSTFNNGVGGNIYVYRSARFSNVFDRDSNEPPGGWMLDDLAFVDDGGYIPGTWSVFRYTLAGWARSRQQNRKTDPDIFINSLLFDLSNDKNIASFTYHDPAKGRIAAKARSQIDYVVDYDPAKYTSGDPTGYAINSTASWNTAQLGTVWWDISSVRYIDYEQGDESYRVQNWGKIANGTNIAIYEWIRSPIPPTDWDSYVAQGTSITIGSTSFVPSGTVRSPLNWSEGLEYDKNGVATKYYYFWVGNSSLSPLNPNHDLTTIGIANLIEDPSLAGLPWYAAISANSLVVGNISSQLVSKTLAQRISYASTKNDLIDFGEWQLVREGDAFSPIHPLLWQRLKASLITFDGLNNDVPDYRLPDYKSVGTLIRPRQTWFKDRMSASRLFVETANSLISLLDSPLVYDQTKMGWQNYFDFSEPQPVAAGSWEYHVATLSDRDALVGVVAPGDRVLVDAVVQTGNLWTIWQYTPLSNNTWQLVRQQSYATGNYWQYTDWYLTGYSVATSIDYVLVSINDLETLTAKSGEIAKVTNGGDGNWQLYLFNNTWQLVGQQNGSIMILDSIFDWQSDFGGFDGFAFDMSGFDGTAAIEFASIIDGIDNVIFSAQNSLQRNKLFFAMLNYVVSEQTNVDWIIRSSTIVLSGFNQALEQTPILSVDNTGSIIDFVNEAKPYHAKIREFVTQRTAVDAAQAAVVDFDVPLSFLTNGSNSLSPADPGLIDTSRGDLLSTAYQETYQSWYANYLSHPELVRSLKTTMLFDRVSAPNVVPGWGDSWDSFTWSNGFNGNYGALTRIFNYYQPDNGMKPKIVADLISGSVYKGVTFASLGFNIDIGWDRAPWGIVAWEADNTIINNYIDQIIQGGSPLEYDTAIGNGQTSIYPLMRQTVNPNNLVVWADGALKLYGTDWHIPTYATTVSVLQGGKGYKVGDQLNIIAGRGTVPTRLTVSAVDNGGIVSVDIAGTGLYDLVDKGPYAAEYPRAYPGSGSGAVFDVGWACSDIQFSQPPSSSPVPNVYILYVGTTFVAAPENASDTYTDGNEFVQPWIDDNHPEELFVFKPKDGLIVDVYQSKAGGRPVVSQKVFVTDGLTDQFDLGVVPQSDNAVLAYLNGKILANSITGDYVINYLTKRMVFIVPPPAGILSITSIGFGGSSRTVKNAFIVNPGKNYSSGDVITINGQESILPCVLQVMSTGRNGRIETIALIEPGFYARLPQQPVYPDSTSGQGFGASFNLQFADNFQLFTFTGDGTTTDYAIPGATPDLPGGILINIDGKIVPWMRLSNGIRLYSPADLGSTIHIATFDTDAFSIVNETDIKVSDPALVSYNIGIPGNSLPNYLAVKVIKNGELVEPPLIDEILGNGTQKTFRLSYMPGDFTTVDVYQDSKRLSFNDYQIISYNGKSEIEFTVAPPMNSQSVLVYTGSATNYTIVGNQINFASGLLELDDDIKVLVYSQDMDYEFRTDGFLANQQGLYTLESVPYDIDSIQVWEDTKLLTPRVDYTVTQIPEQAGWGQGTWDDAAWDITTPAKIQVQVSKPNTYGWGIAWDDQHGWDYDPRVIVTYMLGLPERPALAWRMASVNINQRLDTAIDLNMQTVLLEDVYASSTSISVLDYRKLTVPQNGQPGRVYINGELILFTELHLAPTPQNTHRALLNGLTRNALGTSGAPQNKYNVQFYDGTGVDTLFAIEAATQAISISVFVDDRLMVTNIDYQFQTESFGVYVAFVNPPAPGTRNVKIVSFNRDALTSASHMTGDDVLDAGEQAQIPGGYKWNATSYGMQYTRDEQSQFLLNHPYGV